MNLFIHIVLHLAHNFLQYEHKLSFMKTELLMPIDSSFNDFNFFLTHVFCQHLLHLYSFIMTFLELLFDFNQWQASTFWGSTFTSIFSKISKTVPSSWLYFVLDGKPDISRHSRAEYYSLLRDFRSSMTICFLVISVTDLDRAKSASSLL